MSNKTHPSSSNESFSCSQCGERKPVNERCPTRFDLCNQCGLKWDQELAERARAKQQRERESKWANLCPRPFQTTEFAQLPDQTAAKKVQDWEYGAKGMVTYGPTGSGKTRSIWFRLKRESLKGRTIEAFTATELSARISALFASEPDLGEKFVNKLVAADILFIDDLDKMRATPRVASEFFDLIDRRTSHGRPILLSLNALPCAVVDKFSADNPELGPALIRRIQEFCYSIEFRKPPRP